MFTVKLENTLSWFYDVIDAMSDPPGSVLIFLYISYNKEYSWFYLVLNFER